MFTKQKLDKIAKIEKEKKKKLDESMEDIQGMKQFKSQKYQTIIKRKELIEQDFQKKLQEKEHHLLKRL